MTSNESLKSDIINWEQELSLPSTTQLTQAKLTAVRYVANAIMSQHALLLPQVSKVFLKAYQPTTGVESNDINIDTGDGTIRFTSNWLLNQLVLYFCINMSYKCIHKKFGTILYRKGGDPLISLSWALGNQRQHEA